MATRKNRKTRGRKRGGGENGNANVKEEEDVAPVAANANANAGANSGAAAANAGANSGAAAANAGANSVIQANLDGGKRGTRKRRISRGASKWNQFVMRTFKEMRKKNKDVKLMDAMKECSKQKKKGIKY